MVAKTAQNDAAFTANSTVLLMHFLLKDLEKQMKLLELGSANFHVLFRHV